jgi:hypothetical protein
MAYQIELEYISVGAVAATVIANGRAVAIDFQHFECTGKALRLVVPVDQLAPFQRRLDLILKALAEPASGIQAPPLQSH